MQHTSSRNRPNGVTDEWKQIRSFAPQGVCSRQRCDVRRVWHVACSASRRYTAGVCFSANIPGRRARFGPVTCPAGFSLPGRFFRFPGIWLAPRYRTDRMSRGETDLVSSQDPQNGLTRRTRQRPQAMALSPHIVLGYARHTKNGGMFRAHDTSSARPCAPLSATCRGRESRVQRSKPSNSPPSGS